MLLLPNRFVGLCCLFLMLAACNSTKVVSEFNRDEMGVYHAEKDTIPKGAIRLTVQIKSSQTNDGKTYYVAEVIQIHQSSTSRGTVKPKRGEEVLISAKKDYGFKGGDQVKIDAMTPIIKEGELLNIVML